MILAALDTNILVSALISSHGSPARILAAWGEGGFVLAVSEATLSEFSNVVRRPEFIARCLINSGEVETLIARIRATGQVVPGTSVVGVVPNDPRDDHVISAAVEAGADCIVTGDRHLLDLGSYEDIPILTPAEFVEKLRGV